MFVALPLFGLSRTELWRTDLDLFVYIINLRTIYSKMFTYVLCNNRLASPISIRFHPFPSTYNGRMDRHVADIHWRNLCHNNVRHMLPEYRIECWNKLIHGYPRSNPMTHRVHAEWTCD